MGMADHIDRNPIQADGEIGAVIEIEAAQEILVGLTAARMLGDDDTGNILNNLARRRGRSAMSAAPIDPSFDDDAIPVQSPPRPVTTTDSTSAESAKAGCASARAQIAPITRIARHSLCWKRGLWVC
jgi:hypothetical protein